MITESAAIRQTPAWQRELASAITDPAELLRRLDLPARWLNDMYPATRAFALRVPLSYLARMRRGDPHDPLLRQVLPLADELRPQPGFHADPVGDMAAMRTPGVLQKYAGRVLLITTGACAVHCRYCFRRHFPYGEAHAAAAEWAAARSAIAADSTVTEVILSGGDPLVLPDRRLASLVESLSATPHVRTLRIHTRLPVVLPARIDAELIQWLRATPLRKIVVIHANHANEIDVTVRQALRKLYEAGAHLLNQSVLLRGVNDSAEALAALSEVLFDAGVMPYYLHALDPVLGASHFEVPQREALAIHAALAARLPGYLVPRLVREQIGAPTKVSLSEPVSSQHAQHDIFLR